VEAKRQLHEEADYLREAEQMRRYGAMLAGEEMFVVPAPVEELTGPGVLTMDFIASRPIDTLAEAPQDVRDRVMGAMLDLVLRELFTFGFMQTDPNFANYRWQPETGRIVLLDFGAARSVPAETQAAYARMMHAGLAGDPAELKRRICEVGFASEEQIARHGDAFEGVIGVILDHVNKDAIFDFADRSFVAKLRDFGEPVAQDRDTWHLPPMDTLFVQRKVSGTALLAVRMKARLPLQGDGRRAAGGACGAGLRRYFSQPASRYHAAVAWSPRAYRCVGARAMRAAGRPPPRSSPDGRYSWRGRA